MRARIGQSLRVSDERVGRVVLILLGIGFAALIIAGIAAVNMVSRNQDHVAAVTHTYEVQTQLRDLQTLSERAETARRGFLLDGDSRYVRTVAATVFALPRTVQRIGQLTADNPEQQERALQLEDFSRQQTALLEATVAAIAQGGREQEIVNFRDRDRGLSLIAAIRRVSGDMIDVEDALLAERTAAQRASVAQFFGIVSVAGGLLIIMAIVSLLLMRRYSRDLTESRDQLRGLNAGLEVAVAARTADLQRANDEIQRFAYIVSHDLRSPLVNVMGFTAELEAATKPLAELVDRVEAEQPDLLTKEAALAAREDLPEAAGFIRSSTQKMDRLINAILKLSREGRRVLMPEPIDLVALVDGIRDTLAHKTEEVGGEIRIVEPLPDMVHDRLAVEQILANLIENAVKYRAPHRPLLVEVSGQIAAGRALIDIKDNGRGIDAKDHARIFDLFRRSGLQNEPGEGIGLAHVRALAYRMGGTIICTSEFGQGSTFRLSLPAKFEGEGGKADE
jgi:signal transduction histidine kinase